MLAAKGVAGEANKQQRQRLMGAKPEFQVTARLRCNPQAARNLRDALKKALTMLEAAQSDNAHAAHGEKLN